MSCCPTNIEMCFKLYPSFDGCDFVPFPGIHFIPFRQKQCAAVKIHSWNRLQNLVWKYIYISTSKDSSKSNDLFLKGIFTDFIIEQWLTVKSTPFLSMKCKQSICQKYVSQHFQTLISTSILPTEPWVRKLKWFLRPIPYWLWLRHTACFFLETFGWHLDEGVWMPSRADYLAHTHSQSCNHLKWHRSDHWHNIWLLFTGFTTVLLGTNFDFTERNWYKALEAM